jgi:hypothetical protein
MKDLFIINRERSDERLKTENEESTRLAARRPKRSITYQDFLFLGVLRTREYQRRSTNTTPNSSADHSQIIENLKYGKLTVRTTLFLPLESMGNHLLKKNRRTV